MLITEWQQQFKAAVLSLQHHIYAPTLVKQLLEAEADAEVFKAKAKLLFRKYETNSISSTQGSKTVDPLSPRALWLAIDSITEVEPDVIRLETEGAVATEDGTGLVATET